MSDQWPSPSNPDKQPDALNAEDLAQSDAQQSDQPIEVVQAEQYTKQINPEQINPEFALPQGEAPALAYGPDGQPLVAGMPELAYGPDGQPLVAGAPELAYGPDGQPLVAGAPALAYGPDGQPLVAGAPALAYGPDGQPLAQPASVEPAYAAAAPADPVYGTAPVAEPAYGPDLAYAAAPAADPAYAAAAAAPALAAQLPAALPERKGMSGKAKAWIGVVVALLVLLVGAAIALSVVNSSRGADGVVREYLNAIASGNATRANQIVDPGVPDEQRLLLTDEALGAASQRIEVVEVQKAEVNSTGNATVRATVSLGGERKDLNFTLQPGPGEYGVLDTWRLTTPALGVVDVNLYDVDGINLGGATVARPASAREGSAYTSEQYAYFGVYPVALPEAQATYFTLDTDETSVRVFPGDTDRVHTSITPRVEPNEALVTKVLEAVNARANACVSVDPPTNLDEQCPSVVRSTTLASLSVAAPATRLQSLDATSFRSGDVTFMTQENPTTFNRNPSARRTRHQFYGEITWRDGEPEITVEGSY